MGSNIVIEKSAFSSQIKNQLLTREVKGLMSQNQWNITTGKYTKMKMKQVFTYMRASKVQSVGLWKNNQSNILLDICHINFTHLKILILENNKITNIEAVSWAIAPNLQSVSLNQNEISSIQPIRKWKSTKLNSLNLKLNKISQLNIHQIKLGDKENATLQGELIFDDLKDINLKPILINDLSKIVKIDIFNLVNLSIQNKQRIIQPRLQNAFIRKWNQLCIQNYQKK